MIDSIARALTPQKASLEPQKAVTGPGAAVMSWGTPIGDVHRNSHQMMREAQAVYARGNRWVKRAEMVISGRVGSVPWHLETPDGETVTDDSPDELRRIRDLFEKPLVTEEFARAYPNQPATRRAQWGITSRHGGLCNVAFWHLDELDAAAAFPLRIFTIRPDRLTPEEENGRLTGWTLDKEAHGGGTSLSVEEVLLFHLDPVDKGYFGTGLVESIFSTVALPNSIDRHAIDTLASGGRLPGIYSPKENGAGDDVFDRLVSDLRTIKDLPDSSKRDVVARSPVEFTPTAADMDSLVVTSLSSMSRDDTLAHWGVPLSTIGGYTPAGMNSGETRKYDEAALWQNAVQFRIDMLKETIQFRLLDRLKAIGIELELVIETPTFDDDAPKYELAAKVINVPLRTVERRAILGLDPLGDEALDNAIVLPLNMVTYAEAPEDTMVQKASLKPVKVNIDPLTSKLRKDLTAFLDSQKREISARIREKAAHLSTKPGDQHIWWHGEKWDKALEKVLAPYAAQIADLTAERTSATLGTGKAAFTDLTGNRVLQRLLSRLGTRIKGINETTRQGIAAQIKAGVEAGDGAAQLGDRIEAFSGFDEYRAELIARTESAQVLNESQIESFREFGVNKVRAIDGDDDPECAARDGQEYDVDEAMDISDHPNGTLDWVPVIGEPAVAKAAPIAATEAQSPVALTVNFHQAGTSVNVPPSETPVVNVQVPEQPVTVNVPEQPVTVNVPEQKAPIVNVTAPESSAKASLPAEIRIVSMPTRTGFSQKRVLRDAKGQIVEVLEETAEK